MRERTSDLKCFRAVMLIAFPAGTPRSPRSHGLSAWSGQSTQSARNLRGIETPLPSQLPIGVGDRSEGPARRAAERNDITANLDVNEVQLDFVRTQIRSASEFCRFKFIREGSTSDTSALSMTNALVSLRSPCG
jgi:hypothetical protein